MPGPLKRLLAFILVQADILVNMGRINPNALYIRNHFATFPIALWGKINSKIIVQEVNGPYEDLFIAWPKARAAASLFRWLIRIQLKWASAVVVVTPQLKEWVQAETGRQSIFVIPNATNTELFHPEARLKYTLPKPYVVFVGALAKWQGVRDLLKAVNSAKWPSDVSLVVVGDGAERMVVQQAAEADARVIYLGCVPYRDVPGIVANSLAGLSPQNNEGGRSMTGLLPLKLFESMACGVPVVVTDFPGQADLIRAYNCGVVIPSGDPDALAEAVSFIYSNPPIREDMGRRGREAVVREHSWDQRARATEKVLLELLNGGGKSRWER